MIQRQLYVRGFAETAGTKKKDRADTQSFGILYAVLRFGGTPRFLIIVFSHHIAGKLRLTAGLPEMVQIKLPAYLVPQGFGAWETAKGQPPFRSIQYNRTVPKKLSRKALYANGFRYFFQRYRVSAAADAVACERYPPGQCDGSSVYYQYSADSRAELPYADQSAYAQNGKSCRGIWEQSRKLCPTGKNDSFF